jgi:hypothetical protein
MTKVQNFFENPFNATFNGLKTAATNEANKRTVNAANEVFKDKPYHVENKTTYSIAKMVSLVANAVSFATGFFALQAVLSFVVGYWIATGGGNGFVRAIRMAKEQPLESNRKTVIEIQKQVFSGLWRVGCFVYYLNWCKRVRCVHIAHTNSPPRTRCIL